MLCVSTKLHVPPQQKKRVHDRSYKRFNEENVCNDRASVPLYVSEIFDGMDDSYWFCNSLLSDINRARSCKNKDIKENSSALY